MRIDYKSIPEVDWDTYYNKREILSLIDMLEELIYDDDEDNWTIDEQ